MLVLCHLNSLMAGQVVVKLVILTGALKTLTLASALVDGETIHNLKWFLAACLAGGSFFSLFWLPLGCVIYFCEVASRRTDAVAVCLVVHQLDSTPLCGNDCRANPN
jgi:hypothetical protein